MTAVLKIAKIGENALTETDPRKYVFHSDYNSFTILNESTHSPTLSTTASQLFTNATHGMGYTPFTRGFCKFDNGRYAPPGTRQNNKDFWFTNLQITSTQVKFGYINNTGGNYSPVYRYIQTEVPLSGTPSVSLPTGAVLRIAKSGYNVQTETNPNNIQYDSRYPTLKYFIEGSKTISVPSGSPGAGVPLNYEETIYTHNLGYRPFFTAFAVFSTASTIHYIMPVVFADAGFENYDFIYGDTTKLIFRSERMSPFGGTVGGYTITIYYKIYSYDLDI